MKKEKNWIIIDIKTKKALYGVANKAMLFSSKEIAEEVSEHLFNDLHDCLIVDLVNDLHLSK